MLHTTRRTNTANVRLPALTVQTLGAFRCRHGSNEITQTQWRSQRACELFLLLLTSDGYSVSREYASDQLWPDHLGDAAANNLRVVLHRMRSALEPNGQLQTVVHATHHTIQLTLPSGSTVDSDEFRHAIAAARRSPDGRTALPHLRRACDVYNGYYLANLPLAEWAIPLRAKYAADYAAASTRLGRILLTLNAHTELVERMWRALDIDPSIEEAHEILMQSYAATGNHDLVMRAAPTTPVLLAHTLRDAQATVQRRVYQQVLSS
jgi:two-component system LytT family response regulator